MAAEMFKTYDYERYNNLTKQTGKTASNAELFLKALADIKGAIKIDSQKENVNEQTLTLMKIYDIVEEAEKNLDLA